MQEKGLSMHRECIFEKGPRGLQSLAKGFCLGKNNSTPVRPNDVAQGVPGLIVSDRVVRDIEMRAKPALKQSALYHVKGAVQSLFKVS